jgi:hypothetical protein
MKEYIIIDSEGYYTNRVRVDLGVTAVNYDASTWIEVSDNEDYTKKQYVEGAWVDILVSMDELRVRRDFLLHRTDITQLVDAPITDAKKLEWATYRQLLRDLPALYTPTGNPIYPDIPEGLGLELDDTTVIE